jgi:hypothetical protein
MASVSQSVTTCSDFVANSAKIYAELESGAPPSGAQWSVYRSRRPRPTGSGGVDRGLKDALLTVGQIFLACAAVAVLAAMALIWILPHDKLALVGGVMSALMLCQLFWLQRRGPQIPRVPGKPSDGKLSNAGSSLHSLTAVTSTVNKMFFGFTEKQSSESSIAKKEQ